MPALPTDIDRLDALLRDESRAEAARRAPALRAEVMARLDARPLTINNPQPALPRILGRSFLAAAACCAIAAGAWMITHAPVHRAPAIAEAKSRPSSPFGRARVTLANLTSVDRSLEHEARLIAADFNRAAVFVRAQLPLRRASEALKVQGRS